MIRISRGWSTGLAGAAGLIALALCAGCAQSDAGITTQVKAKLEASRDLSSSGIHVDTANRVVTLSGTAVSEAERQKAVQLAKGTEGVKDVVDHLSVSPAAAPPAAAPPVSTAAPTSS
jgi:osmotically-inducible protein OsmY